MVSAIDSTVIIDDQDVSKNQLRAQLDIAKTEISALQALISGDSILEGGLNISIAGTIDFPSVTLPVNETKRMVAFDNSSAAQTIRFLVDDASFLALPDNVLLMLVRCTSAANSLSITTNTAGRLRTNNYLDTAFHNTQVDTVFLGYSRAKQTGLWLPIYKDGGFVFIDGPVRQNDTDDFAIVPNRPERVLTSAANITEEVTRRANHNQIVKVESGTHVFTLPTPLSDQDVTMFFWNAAGTLTVNGTPIPATKTASLILLSGDAKLTVEA